MSLVSFLILTNWIRRISSKLLIPGRPPSAFESLVTVILTNRDAVDLAAPGTDRWPPRSPAKAISWRRLRVTRFPSRWVLKKPITRGPRHRRVRPRSCKMHAAQSGANRSAEPSAAAPADWKTLSPRQVETCTRWHAFTTLMEIHGSFLECFYLTEILRLVCLKLFAPSFIYRL